MYAYISTNLETKKVELAIVDAEGGILQTEDGMLHAYPVRSFLDVLLAYHAYRADHNPAAPKFEAVKDGLEGQWDNLHNYSQRKAT